MFEKSLADLIRGIRANKKNEAAFISSCLEEITSEIKSNDIDIKAVALQKLTYLNMMGYDMTWASFHVVEVMSSPKFQYKRIGYLAAAQSFNKDTDVLMLCTNLIKKDLSSNKMYETALALNGLSQIVTPDLARDLIDDLLRMMNHSQPYIRKRVVVLLYKVFLQYPEALIMSYPKLKEKLEDDHPSVVIATVSVICELATHNPRNYLPLVPQLYNILTTSSNNWLSIKVVKLLALLAPEEPRLAKKILPAFGLILEGTTATSFAYEVLNAMIRSGIIKQANQPLIGLCIEKLKEFIVDRDANLRYLGLLTLSELIAIFPKLVVAFTDIILERLDDIDLTIRRKALDLVPAMVTKPTLMPIVDKLMSYLFKEEDEWFNNINIFTDKDYRNCIVNNILNICSKDKYANISNFQWYICILCNLAFVENISVVEDIAKQMMDICIRLKDTPLRKFFINKMVELLKNKVIFEKKFIKAGNTDILYVAAYLLGEYRSSIDIESVEDILFNLTTDEVRDLSGIVQTSYIISILKIYIYWLLKSDFNESSVDAYKQITTMLMDKLQIFIDSSDIEVQDRANLALEILNKIYEQYNPINTTNKKFIEGIDNLFNGELKPVAAKAQKMVPVPPELDLDKVINEESETILNEIDTSFADETKYFWTSKIIKSKTIRREPSKQEIEESRRRRRQSKKDNPFYLDFEEDVKSQNSFYESELDNIPIVQFTYNYDEKLNIDTSNEIGQDQKIVFLEDEEIPEGAIEIKDDDDKEEEEKVLKNLDLTNIEFMDSTIPVTENKEVKKKKKGKKTIKKDKKAVDDTTKTKKKKGTKKNKKSKKTSEDKENKNEILKPIVGEKTITIPNNQSNLVKINPVSIHSSLSSKEEQKKTKKVIKKKIPESSELMNQYLPVKLNENIISMVYKWEFTSEPNVIHAEFLLKNNIENEKVKIIKFEIAETMKAHIINIDSKLPLTIPANQAISIGKKNNAIK